MSNKRYFYVFLTRDGFTTLPSKGEYENDVENMQYLGELKSNSTIPKEALEEFLTYNAYINEHYSVSDIVIKRFPNQVETFYLNNQI